MSLDGKGYASLGSCAVCFHLHRCVRRGHAFGQPCGNAGFLFGGKRRNTIRARKDAVQPQDLLALWEVLRLWSWPLSFCKLQICAGRVPSRRSAAPLMVFGTQRGRYSMTVCFQEAAADPKLITLPDKCPCLAAALLKPVLRYLTHPLSGL